MRGDLFGLLAAHPTVPLVSIHHLDHMEPIFPNMTTIKALEHFYEAGKIDTGRLLQQTVCYDRWFSWTISVSWGYAVQVFAKHIYLPDVLPVQESFKQWKKSGALANVYTFNTREFHRDPCQRPTIFFMDSVVEDKDGNTMSVYKISHENCSVHSTSPRKLDQIRVMAPKLNLDRKQVCTYIGPHLIDF